MPNELRRRRKEQGRTEGTVNLERNTKKRIKKIISEKPRLRKIQ